MSSTVSLPNHTLTGQTNERLTSSVHIISPETDNFLLESAKGSASDCRKYFMINLHEGMLCADRNLCQAHTYERCDLNVNPLP